MPKLCPIAGPRCPSLRRPSSGTHVPPYPLCARRKGGIGRSGLFALSVLGAPLSTKRWRRRSSRQASLVNRLKGAIGVSHDQTKSCRDPANQHLPRLNLWNSMRRLFHGLPRTSRASYARKALRNTCQRARQDFIPKYQTTYQP